jgi:hypothetical protein
MALSGPTIANGCFRTSRIGSAVWTLLRRYTKANYLRSGGFNTVGRRSPFPLGAAGINIDR